MTSEALAKTIAGAIVPELQAAEAHLKSVRGVPTIHGPLVADAVDYLHLRTQSWNLRAEGLRMLARVPAQDRPNADLIASARTREHATASYRATTTTLSKAEAAERASLAALERTRQDAAAPTKQP